MTSTGWIQHLAGSVGPMPGGLLTIGIPLLIWVGLRFVPFRRLLYAVGSNDATAFSSGVNVNAVRVASYALGGLFAGFGGPGPDRPGELGRRVQRHGVHPGGDRGRRARRHAPSRAGGADCSGPLLGAFSIYLLQNLLATFAINPAYLQIVYGGILIVAVVLGGARRRAIPAAGSAARARPGAARRSVVPPS